MEEFEDVIKGAEDIMKGSIASIYDDDTLSEDERRELLAKSFEECFGDLSKAFGSGKKKSDGQGDGSADTMNDNPEGDYANDTYDDTMPENIPERKKKQQMDKSCGGDKKKVTKSADTVETETEPEKENDVSDVTEEFRKSLAASQKELEDLKKSIEMSKLTELAKKYTVIGKDPVKLAKSLYDFKSQDVALYKEYVASLDDIVKIQEESGIFKEIGTSREGGEESEMERVTKSLMTDGKMSRSQAMLKAVEDNPAFMDAYDAEYNRR